MDQIFTQDSIRSRSILNTICGCLSLEDLLCLEHVTRVTREAVQRHHYASEATLCWFDDKLVLNGWRAGPIITSARLGMRLSSSLTDWNWMISTLEQRSDQLKKLYLNLRISLLYADWKCCTHIESQMRSSLLVITFSRCSQLEVHFSVLQDPNLNYMYGLRTILKHFPVLERVKLTGDHLPLLSCLPAPERLKHLTLNVSYPGSCWSQIQLVPITVNFAGLETVCFAENSNLDTDQEINEDTMTMTRVTGVHWSSSLSRHPPGRLRQVTLGSLSRWNVMIFLASFKPASPSSPCHSLAINEMMSECDTDLLKSFLDQTFTKRSTPSNPLRVKFLDCEMEFM